MVDFQILDIFFKGRNDLMNPIDGPLFLIEIRSRGEGPHRLLGYSIGAYSVFTFDHLFNLQRILQYLNQMGASQHTKTLLSQFHVEKTNGNLSVLAKKNEGGVKYLMKTYTANTKEELVSKLRFFKDYKAKMEENQELTKLVEIIEEKDEHFCSTSHRLHLIFEYSDLNIGREIKVRRQSMLKVNKVHTDIAKSKYFNYQDLCNILYSCLSALWFNSQLLSDNPDCELKKFGTIFLSSQNILIFGNGVLKIMDPFVNDFNHRYNFTQNVYYAPEKLADFSMVDDQKCSIFELGMTLLEISLLEPISDAYSGYEYMEEVTTKKLEKARQIYASDIENSLTVSAFDLIERMVERERQDRFLLEEAIEYAEQMYEIHETLAQEASSSNPTRFYSNSGTKRKELNRTNHSSSAKKTTSINKFYDFKNSTVCARDQDSLQQSPKITNFTIHEVDAQREEQSSMLQSLTVDNLLKQGQINQSLFQGGVFSAVNIGDSYIYGNNHNHANSLRFNNTLKDEKLFTDPQLMKTIYRELEEISNRKRSRMRDDSMFHSKVCERKDRFDLYQQANTGVKITNIAYLQ